MLLPLQSIFATVGRINYSVLSLDPYTTWARSILALITLNIITHYVSLVHDLFDLTGYSLFLTGSWHLAYCLTPINFTGLNLVLTQCKQCFSKCGPGIIITRITWVFVRSTDSLAQQKTY